MEKHKPNNTKNIKPKYDALTIAKYLFSLDSDRKYFSNKKVKNKVTLTPIILGNFRLNQMLYLLQLSYYINDKKILFNDDLYAWENGIVVYSVYSRFQELYLQKNGQIVTDINEEDKKNIARRFGYLKTIPDRKLQEFSYHDPAWSSTWGVSSQPKIEFTNKENLEIYQRFCSHWLRETRL